MAGGIAGGAVSAGVAILIWWRDTRVKTGRELLVEGMAIHALREAWVLEGTTEQANYKTTSISVHKNLATKRAPGALWLRKVEVRAVLDQPDWNAPNNQFYGFIDGGRAWAVRDNLPAKRSYELTIGTDDPDPHPALLSSRAIHELCAWVERIASICWSVSGIKKPIAPILSRHTLIMLGPLLLSLSGEDRIRVLGDRLSKRSQRFLHWYRKKYGSKLHPQQKRKHFRLFRFGNAISRK